MTANHLYDARCRHCGQLHALPKPDDVPPDSCTGCGAVDTTTKDGTVPWWLPVDRAPAPMAQPTPPSAPSAYPTAPPTSDALRDAILGDLGYATIHYQNGMHRKAWTIVRLDPRRDAGTACVCSAEAATFRIHLAATWAPGVMSLTFCERCADMLAACLRWGAAQLDLVDEDPTAV